MAQPPYMQQPGQYPYGAPPNDQAIMMAQQQQYPQQMMHQPNPYYPQMQMHMGMQQQQQQQNQGMPGVGDYNSDLEESFYNIDENNLNEGQDMRTARE